MASVRRVGFSRDLARLFGAGTVAGLGEGQLLDRFAVDGDEVAFEALVARHGPMVLGVCRRSLRDEHAAEDAFQATFLVLARKAGSLRRPERLGPWLHGVARKVSARSRAVAARRAAREARAGVPDAVDLPPDADLHRRSVAAAIHDEISRLPESYRAPIVLCSLQGLTHDEAARHLAWPVGTVRGRLARARALLKSRLARRGFGLAAGGLAVELSSATAAVSPRLIAVTASLATSARIGSAGAIPAAVSFLSHGVLSAMYYDKLIKLAGFGAMALGLSAAGAGVLAGQEPPTPEPTPPAAQTATVAPGLVEPKPAEPDRPAEATGSDQESEARAASLDQAQVELAILEQEVEDAKRRLGKEIVEYGNAKELMRFREFRILEEKGAATTPEQIKGIEEREANRKKSQIEILDRSKLYFQQKSLELGRRKREVAALERRIEADEATDRPIRLSPPHKIRPGDILLVEVLEALPGRPITGERLVKGDGTLRLGFYGEISITGLTLREAKEKIILHLRRFLNDEALGLRAMSREGKTVDVKPADSDRVFIDDMTSFSQTTGMDFGSVKARLDRIQGLLKRNLDKDR